MSEQIIDRHAFGLERPQVLSVEGNSAGGEPAEEHAYWIASFGVDNDDAGVSYIVIATLHIADEYGNATVTIGGTFRPLLEIDDSDVESLIVLVKNSAALQLLFDFAASSMNSVCSLANISLDVPLSMEAEVDPLNEEQDPDNTTDD